MVFIIIDVFLTIVTILICILTPILLSVFWVKIKNVSIKTILVGALTFLIFQPLTRLQILNILQNNMWFKLNFLSNIFITALFYGGTAAIFEECGRFIAFKYIIRKNHDWAHGIGYGIGHGGFEAIYICIFMILPSIVNTLTLSYSIPGYMILLPGIERLFTITIQIALSLIVLYGVKTKKNIFLLYAIILHTVLDASSLFIHNPILSEFYISLYAIASLIFIIKSKKLFNIEGDNKKYEC